VIRPAKLWCDTESAPEAAELASRLGRGVVASFTSSKLLWLKRHEPASFAKLLDGGKLALPHDYLNLQLTGQLVRGPHPKRSDSAPGRSERPFKFLSTLHPLTLPPLSLPSLLLPR
jgi:hypothetical protein